ncbi:unnamed protein product, partial [marine sediment metagenome]
MKWEPKDVIACIIVAGCIAMICLGINSTIKIILLAVVGVYYGVDLTPWVKLGR